MSIEHFKKRVVIFLADPFLGRNPFGVLRRPAWARAWRTDSGGRAKDSGGQALDCAGQALDWAGKSLDWAGRAAGLRPGGRLAGLRRNCMGGGGRRWR